MCLQGKHIIDRLATVLCKYACKFLSYFAGEIPDYI